MQRTSSMRQPAQLLFTALLLLVGSIKSYSEDTYNGTQLTIPSLTIGNATISNVVVTPLKIISIGGGAAAGSVDSYNPANNELTIPIVFYAGTTYTNVTITVASLVSAGSVIGADFYNIPELDIPSVHVLGSAVYNDVVITVGGTFSYSGGMPRSAIDVYDPTTNQLTIPVIQFNGQVHTNAMVTVGNVVSVGASPYTDTILHTFITQFGLLPSGTNLAAPTSLMLGIDGNFYGTTMYGGQYSHGGIFKKTPGGTVSVLYSFGATGDGSVPNPGLIQDSQGNFYGTTLGGGANNQGTIFKITASGTEPWHYSFFGGNDGAMPLAGLVRDTEGNFYGTTSAGGGPQYGTVFKVTPTGVESVIYSFTGGNGYSSTGTDGGIPMGGLVIGNDGNLYGTTAYGGLNNSSNFGTVFKVTPAGDETVLYSFGSASGDGRLPEAALVLGNDGNLYGTTGEGGEFTNCDGTYHGAGTVFKVTPDGVETVLHSFVNGPGPNGLACSAAPVDNSWDGSGPQATLILGSDGNFYSTTSYGGIYNQGTVFRITPAGVESVLHAFNCAVGTSDGCWPTSSLVVDSKGNLYGVTANGGGAVAAGMEAAGTVFELPNAVPPP